MKIGIDARMMGPEVRGIGRYVAKLLEHLAKLPHKHEFTVFTRKEAAHLVPASMRTVFTDIGWYGLREQKELPRIFDGEKLDLIHVPHWNAPLLLKTPLAITIHDMILWEHPSLEGTKLSPIRFVFKYLAYRFLVSRNTKHARHIFTVSTSAANALERILATAGEKISITPLGVDTLPTAPSKISELQNRNYILNVGSGYPHKNLKTFFETFRLLAGTDPTLQAIAVGIDAAFLSRVRAQMHAILGALASRVELLGVIDDNTLGALYKNTKTLIFTSKAEGFGLPPLEAASFGIPVLSSNIDTTRETLGFEGAWIAKNNSAEEFARLYKEMLENTELRSSKISASRATIVRFSWEETARTTLLGYQRALSSA